jgi:hypothetical protein
MSLLESRTDYLNVKGSKKDRCKESFLCLMQDFQKPVYPYFFFFLSFM